ncbi:MAG: hypothetical protein L3J71_03510 [Victivallaceae bacterium]|nr:hypothetical protein [Victivallaceae bacterium]
MTPQQLNASPEFQKIVANDPELKRLNKTPLIPPAQKEVEMLITAGGEVLIAGKTFPAPAAAVLCLLETIESPFMVFDETDDDDDYQMIDVFRALYVMFHREKAVLPILAAKSQEMRFQQLEQRMKDQAGKQQMEMLLFFKEVYQEIAAVWSEFDRKALEFGLALGAFDWQTAALNIQVYLSLASGLLMLPDVEADSISANKKKAVSSMPIG